MGANDWTSRGPSYAEEYRTLARQLARRYAVMEGVVGVALVGGLTFGEADRYSDVDLIVYLHEQSLRTWYFGEAPLPEGESIYHGLRLDVSYRDFAAECEREWTLSERWNASRAEILYDPEKRVEEMIGLKVGAAPESLVLQATIRAVYVRFLLDRIVPGWLYRGEVVAAHHVLNRAADQLIGLVHLINQRLVPGDDWNATLVEHLEWTPESFQERIKSALVAPALTSDEASRRRHQISRMLAECWQRIAPDDPLENRFDFLLQRRILREMSALGSMTLREFLERYERRTLIQSPAYDLLRIDRSGNEPLVVFDHDRLIDLNNRELGRFLDYQQRLLRELAAAPGTEVDS